MGTVNKHWFVSNTSRSYPVDDTATATDDTGSRLPDDILVDLKLKFPDSMGDIAFVSAMSVSTKLVTVLISAAFRSSPAVSRPIAAVTTTKPVNVYSIVSVQPLEAGVGGWMVYGSGANLRSGYSGRFSFPSQSLLCSKAAQPYSSLPISSVGVLDITARLTGLVKLQSLDSNLVLAAEDLTLDGVPTRAITLKVTTETNKDSLQAFAGDCGARPESGTCLRSPIETINGISPDCEGKIYLQFSGQVVVSRLADLSGVVLESTLSIDSACGTVEKITDSITEAGTDDCDPLTGMFSIPAVDDEVSPIVGSILAVPDEDSTVLPAVQFGSLDFGVFPSLITWPSIAVSTDRVFSLRIEFLSSIGECGLVLRYSESGSTWDGVLISLNRATQKLMITAIENSVRHVVYVGSVPLSTNTQYVLTVTTQFADPMAIVDVQLSAAGAAVFSLTGIGLVQFVSRDTGVYGVLVDGAAVEFFEPTLE